MSTEYNFTIDQGADFDRTLTWRDEVGKAIDLTGYTGDLQGRFKVDSTVILIQMSTVNLGMVLGGTAGTIQLKRTAAQTQILDFSVAVYDLELVSSGGQVTKLFNGDITLNLEVTR